MGKKSELHSAVSDRVEADQPIKMRVLWQWSDYGDELISHKLVGRGSSSRKGCTNCPITAS